MQRNIDFYFDFTSPYSYVASGHIETLAARYEFTVTWKPILLGFIFRTTGGPAITGMHPWKARYALADFERNARHHGMPYRHPTQFPQATQHPVRATLWLQQAQPELAVPFVREVYRAIFVEDKVVNEPETLAAIGETLAIDREALLGAIKAPAFKEASARLNAEAEALEIFGAPTFVVEGERFWGSDRMAHLEQRLRELAGGKRSVKSLVDEASARVRAVSPEQAMGMRVREDVVFVDLRDVRELKREGIIPGAVHAPRGMLEFWVDPSSPYYKQVFTPDKTYVLFCAAAWRSALACATMMDMGFLPDVMHLEGGFEAWRKAGGEVGRKE
ncbi:MAG: DsbA family protein [Burkholderiales bacterium]|nr:MAG: DsbA family protein [Burkholderiales bacterium]